MFTIENFINGIHNATNISVEKQESKLILTRKVRDFENKANTEIFIGEIPLEEIHNIISESNDCYTCKGSMLLSVKTFEVAIQEHKKSILSFRNDYNKYKLSEHNYKFVLSNASAIYIFSMICSSVENSNYKLYYRYSYSSQPIFTINDFFDCFRIFTIKIFSEKNHSLLEFERMLHSYLFNISYNYDRAFSVVNFSDTRRSFRRRANRTGQLFPYKSYNRELTKYYHQAIATDIPFTQYLAFYHVPEFFFQTISERDVFEEIKKYITHPAFSPNENEDIKNFYNMIKKKMREQRDDGVWNEKVGLLLCLKKYVPDLQTLKTTIDAVDSTAISYYENSLVEFANESKTINFNEDIELLYSNIRDRIYSVRNAIVHSKEGDKLRYEPFKHDKHLEKEIPLIRSVAEEIIVNSAKSIEYNFENK